MATNHAHRAPTNGERHNGRISRTLLLAILARLAVRGRDDAMIEHGACISIPTTDCLADATCWFGTANGTWQGDVTRADGDVVATLETGLRATHSRPATIADAMLTAIHAYEDGL